MRERVKFIGYIVKKIEFTQRTDSGLFELHWSDEGFVVIKSPSNNKFITSRMNGSLAATSNEASEKERLVLGAS